MLFTRIVYLFFHATEVSEQRPFFRRGQRREISWGAAEKDLVINSSRQDIFN